MTQLEFVAQKGRVDVAQAFLMFMTLVGDVTRTAAALDLDPVFVEMLAKEEGWTAKIQRVSLMSKSEKPGDYERGVNRALCFVQAHRLRLILDRVLTQLEKEKDVVDAVAAKKEKGDSVSVTPSAKYFAEVAAAMEKAHAMSYHALGDTLTERKERDALEGADASASQLHASLIAALNGVNVSPAKELDDAQDVQAKDLLSRTPVKEVVAQVVLPTPEATT